MTFSLNMITLRFAASIVVCVLTLVPTVFAQELDATVSVDTRQLRSEDRAIVASFGAQATEYLRSYQWTSGEWSGPKVKLSIQVAITQANGGGSFNAQAIVVSQRGDASGDQMSPVIRVLDPSWQFTYQPGSPILHVPGSFNSLASFFDFYAYLALGEELDSRSDLGGSNLLRKAYDICLQGQSDPNALGWVQGINGYSRYGYISELLDPRFEIVRRISYSYHALGLDKIATAPDEALHSLHGVVDTLAMFKTALNGPSISLERFLDAKYLELGTLFQSAPDKNEIFQKLEIADPSHKSQYEDARTR